MDIKYGRRRLVLREEKRRIIEKNIPNKEFGPRAIELLADVAARTMKEECLEDTHLVVKALTRYELGSSGCYCFIIGVFRDYDLKKNTFWVKCNITPSPTITEKDTEKFVEDTKRLVEIAMQKRYGLDVIFGSPP